MNSSNCPPVDIGLPVYNGGSGIERALDSVLNQTYTNVRVLVSDNASTDDTREVCERICALDSRVHFVRQPVNRGPAANFQAVLDLAQGDFFMWLGHDDWLSERYVEECVTALSKKPDVSLVCGQAIYHLDGKEPYRGDTIQLTQERPDDRVGAYFGVVTDNGTFYGLMRRKQLLRVRMRNVMGADWLMIASIAVLGKVITVPSISVNRSVGGSSVSYESIARLLGLPKFQAVFPHVAIAYFAFKDIAWSDPLYSRSLGVFQRVHLAWKCQKRIRMRHGASSWDVFRTILSLCKQYGRSLIASDDEEVHDPRKPRA